MKRWLVAEDLETLVAAADFVTRGCDVDATDARAGGLLGAAFHPLLRRAAAIFDEPTAIAWGPGARRGLLSSLSRRWIACAWTVLYAELRAANLDPQRFVDEKLRAAADWRRLFARHPVVATLMSRSLEAWRRELQKLAQRLDADAGMLALARPITVAALTVHAGEHEGRRWTMSLELDGGLRLLYRPRDLRIVPWFMELTALLNQSLSTPLHQRRVIANRDYAWDEFVARAPCRDAAEAERFYRRMGILMRLLQLLRATDMHVHNLIGAGEHPVIIDVETLLQPVARLSAIERARLATPLDTGLLPFWIQGDPGRRAVDGSALGTGEAMAMPYRVPLLQSPASAQAGFARGYDVPRAAPTILPLVDGKLTSPGAHLEAIQAGYREMDELAARETRLPSLLARAAELPVRAFVRGNITYKRAQFEAMAPSLLCDDERRKTALARMLAGPNGELAADDPLLRAELDALLDLRHPRFWSLPGDDALLCADGRRVAGFFAGRALDAVSITQDETARARNLDAIRSALALADAQTQPAPPRATRPLSTSLEAATAIGELLCAEAIADGDELHFLGAAWMPWAAARPLGPLPLDLLSGNAGLAIVLAALHRHAGLSRFRVAAEAALAPIRRAVESTLPALEAWQRDAARFAARWLFCGAFHGWGAQLYALARVRALLDDRHEPLAADLVRLFPLALAERAPNDLAMGLPGFALAAATLAPLPPSLLALVDGFAALPDPPYPDGPPDFLPGAALSRRLVATRLGKARGEVAAGPLLYRFACGDASPSEIAAGLAASPSLESLELALAAPQHHDRAVAIAARLRDQHARTGCWLDGRVADRHHLSALTGLGALAYSFLRVDAPALGSLRLVA